MSVRVIDRQESKVLYITKAIDIEKKTIFFILKMSKKYRDFFAPKIGELVINLVSHCESANIIFPDSTEHIAMREAHLLEADPRYQLYLSNHSERPTTSTNLFVS